MIVYRVLRTGSKVEIPTMHATQQAAMEDAKIGAQLYGGARVDRFEIPFNRGREAVCEFLNSLFLCWHASEYPFVPVATFDRSGRRQQP